MLARKTPKICRVKLWSCYFQ